MKTLADIKRRAVIGQKMRLISAAYNGKPIMQHSLHIDRAIIRVCSRCVIFPYHQINWPRASGIHIDSKDTFTIRDDGLIFTYKFIE